MSSESDRGFDEEFDLLLPRTQWTAIDGNDNDGGTETRFRIFRSLINAPSPPPSSIDNTKQLLLSPVLVLHHGAGHTALTWLPLVQQLRRLLTDPSHALHHALHPGSSLEVIAFDCRGHGQTTSTCNNNRLTLPDLSNDLLSILDALYGLRRRKSNDGKVYEITLMGHSMGGAVVVDCALRLPHLISSHIMLEGVVMVDVVGGTAMEALVHMKQYLLLNRPPSFTSEQQAIQWAIQSNTSRRLDSARFSIPSQLRLNPETGRYEWRTDLLATEPFWSGWFEQLSEKFLEVKAAKLLVVAGTDRLDKPLTIGQISGKFQMAVLPQCGHCIQEDDPQQLASASWEFIFRNSKNNLPDILKKKLLESSLLPR